MNKFFGTVGYVVAVEEYDNEAQMHTGVYKECPIEKTYYGDVLRKSFRMSQGDKINGDLVVDNEISILSDRFVLDHLQYIKYVRWNGTTWAVASVRPEYPRLILTLGGLYNGPTA